MASTLGLDVKFLLSIMVFIGAIGFLSAMYYVGMPAEQFNITSANAPPTMTGNALADLASFLGFMASSVFSLTVQNPYIFAIVIVPIMVVMAYIIYKMIPFI